MSFDSSESNLGVGTIFTSRREKVLADLKAAPSHALTYAITRVSDHFIHMPGKHTPWDEAVTLPAYISYFLPLNLVRLKAVFREVERFLPSNSVGEIWDFGSGPGTLHWLLEEQEHLTPRPFYCLERSREAMDAHKRLMAVTECRWQPQFNPSAKPGKNALAVFSYAWLEMRNDPPDLSSFEHVLLIEPATRECGRLLMEARQNFVKQGFNLVAPCTHSGECPLLVHSVKDWCHFRVGFDGPPDWQRLEASLPMKNRTLTYSYLLLSRSANHSSVQNAVRVLGDTMVEKGKTRQLICRGPKREFLSWMHKKIDTQRIPSGAIVQDLAGAELRSDEIRVSSNLIYE